MAPLLAGASGVALWPVVSTVLSLTPGSFRFVIALFVFTLGPGSIILWVTRDSSRPARVWLACGAGVGLSPAIADVLARLGSITAYPYVVSGLTGAALAAVATNRPDTSPASLHVGWRGTLVAAVALATGSVAFAHRLTITPAEVTVFGDYDSVDLSYYAAITSELTHHVPPLAPFYSGHALNYSWYPQMLLAMVHRFGAVAILPMYFKLAWPAFISLASVCGYLFVAEAAGAGSALVAVLLILVGGDFSWIAAWLFKPATYLWDWLLWPTNFLAPTVEVLHFSTWTPSLPIMFVGLFALARQLERDDRHAGLIAAICFALLVQFKPFAFAVLISGMLAALIAGRLGSRVRWHLAATASVSVAFALPFIYQILSLYGESRSHLKFDFFLLPLTMLDKLNLRRYTAGWHPLVAGLAATPLFFAGGFGVRWIGVPRILRAAFSRSASDQSGGGTTPRISTIERVLAWMALAGVGLPFVLVTDPYNDTLQFYQTGLYLMWIFTAVAIVSMRGTRRPLAIAAAFALALPPSIHFLRDKWNDDPLHPMAGAARGERLIAEYLRGLDRDRTVMLHDRPAAPSLLVILSERRSVLSWAPYVTGSEERRADVEQFFGSADGDPQQALETLTKYDVTHVVVRRQRDRVHPQVLASLRQLLGTPEAILYEVQ